MNSQRILAVVPSNPLNDYVAGGMGATLERYYNPRGYFSKVYVLSPLESREYAEFGMQIIPTRDRELPGRIRALGVSLVRAYGGNWPCAMVTRFRVSHVPVVVSLHDRRPAWFDRGLARADRVFAVSEEVASLAVRAGADASRVCVVVNKVDLSLMYPRSVGREILPGLREGERPVLFIGRLSPEKNLDGLIQALALCPDIRLFVAGAGDQAPYRQMADKLAVARRCEFLGAVARAHLADLINACGCVCNPSHTEAQSLALMEALACGAAVVTGRVAARGVGITDGQDGYVIDDVGDPELIARNIQRVFADDRSAADIRRRAAELARRFDSNTVEEQEMSEYARLLEAASGGGMRRPWWEFLHRI